MAGAAGAMKQIEKEPEVEFSCSKSEKLKFMKPRRTQKEMEEQKRKKEAEEAETLRLEEERRLKAEKEVRRKAEEDEEEKKKVASMQEDLDRANARLAEAEQREQEKILHLDAAQRQASANKKYDLSKWRYPELRDTINTSYDVELLGGFFENPLYFNFYCPRGVSGGIPPPHQGLSRLEGKEN